MKKILIIGFVLIVMIWVINYYFFINKNSFVQYQQKRSLVDQINKQIKREKQIKQITNYILKQKKLLECDEGLPYKKYIRCLTNRFWNDIQEVVFSLPSDLQEQFKKDYYKVLFYSPSHLVKYKVDDPIALDIKKQYIKYLYEQMRITSPSACNKLPEKETRQYCKDLFK